VTREEGRARERERERFQSWGRRLSFKGLVLDKNLLPSQHWTRIR